MESDEIARQEAFNEVLADRQILPEITRWERGMQGEPNGTGFALLLESIAEKLGQKHEMVIVDPDQCSSFSCVGNCICEQLVDSFIGLPWAVVEGYPGLIVEDRPQDSIWPW